MHACCASPEMIMEKLLWRESEGAAGLDMESDIINALGTDAFLSCSSCKVCSQSTTLRARVCRLFATFALFCPHRRRRGTLQRAASVAARGLLRHLKLNMVVCLKLLGFESFDNIG